MFEVTHNVQLEPQLHPMAGENQRYHSAIQDDDARVDIRASGWINIMLMRSAFGRLSMEVLPSLFFVPQVAWEGLLPSHTNTLLACSVRSGVSHILW